MTRCAARVFHTAHSPDDDGGVGLFSTVKWVCFQLSKFWLTYASGYIFGRQMGLFSLDKNKWGTFRGSMNGVHFEFAYYNEKKTGIEYVRFSVGVENPLMSGFRDQFKRDVLASMESRGIKLPETEFAMWPNAGVQHGAKLLEYRTVLDIHAWERVINKYKQLIDVGFFNAVADVMKEYNSRGCFNPPLQFPT
jgi:hypothetical protein